MKRFLVYVLLPLSFLACSESRETRLQNAQEAIDAGDYAAAETLYADMLDGNPHDPQSISGMIAISRLSGATEEHVYWCERLLTLRPWDRSANLVVGRSLLEKGQLSEAAVRLLLALHDSTYQNEKEEVVTLLEELKREELKNVQLKQGTTP